MMFLEVAQLFTVYPQMSSICCFVVVVCFLLNDLHVNEISKSTLFIGIYFKNIVFTRWLHSGMLIFQDFF